MKLKITTAVALLGLSLTPVFAGEGNGEPFRNNAGTLGTRTVLAGPVLADTGFLADTGSAAYPSFAGRSGSDLTRLAGDILPVNGSEGAIQTASSLPVGAEQGTVAYAQANQVRGWVLAHSRTQTPVVAFARTSHDGNG